MSNRLMVNMCSLILSITHWVSPQHLSSSLLDLVLLKHTALLLVLFGRLWRNRCVWWERRSMAVPLCQINRSGNQPQSAETHKQTWLLDIRTVRSGSFYSQMMIIYKQCRAAAINPIIHKTRPLRTSSLEIFQGTTFYLHFKDQTTINWSRK